MLLDAELDRSVVVGARAFAIRVEMWYLGSHFGDSRLGFPISPDGAPTMHLPSIRCPRHAARFSILFVAVLFLSSHVGLLKLFAAIGEYIAPIVWPQPPIIQPDVDNGPPSDAIVLFDGKDMSAFQGGEDWKARDGCVTADMHDIETKQVVRRLPAPCRMGRAGEGRGPRPGRGNSGVFMMSNYEIQVLDSYNNDTYYDGQCASVYKQHPPMVNASRKPGQWQTYDIIWEGPRFDKQGKLLKPAYATVLHNGVVVQNHFELTGPTSWFRRSRNIRRMPTRCRCVCSFTATRSASATFGFAR